MSVPQAGEGTVSAWGRGHSESGEGAEIDLTAQVRALYEGSAVPVAEIAALAGVTERTIYKYAAKHGWKPRYAWMPGGGRPPAKPRGAGAQQALRRERRRQEKFAPAKGAGGRFIRRGDKGKPFAIGLKATDAAAARRAAAQCAEADWMAREAQAEAQWAKCADERLRAMRAANRALAELEAYRDERRRKNRGVQPAQEDGYEKGLRVTLEATVDWWEAARRDEEEALDVLGEA